MRHERRNPGERGAAGARTPDTRHGDAAMKLWLFITIMLVSVTMWALGGHVLELGPKMSFEPHLYVSLHRTLYPNFGRFAGIAEVLSVLSTVVLALRLRHVRTLAVPTAFAAGFLVVAHVLFWILVYPANVTMAAWPLDQIPDDWTHWRDRWEYGHAARAVLTFAALGLLVGSLLRRGEDRPKPAHDR